jgi:hypothetical protein
MADTEREEFFFFYFGEEQEKGGGTRNTEHGTQERIAAERERKRKKEVYTKLSSFLILTCKGPTQLSRVFSFSCSHSNSRLQQTNKKTNSQPTATR